MQKANLNSIVLKNYFSFLIKQGAVEGRYVGANKIVYMITERGLYLTKCFIELNHLIPTREKLELKSLLLKQRMNLSWMSAETF